MDKSEMKNQKIKMLPSTYVMPLRFGTNVDAYATMILRSQLAVWVLAHCMLAFNIELA
jgi:hypothetical protein